VVDLMQAWSRSEVRYIIVGIWNTFFALFTFVVILNLFEEELELWLILTISSAIGVSQSFTTQRKFVWQSTNVVWREFPKFITVSTFQYLANIALLHVFTQWLGLPVLASQLVIMVILIMTTFVVFRLWVFSIDSETAQVSQNTNAQGIRSNNEQ
jgi:putative flippase GtrA